MFKLRIFLTLFLVPTWQYGQIVDGDLTCWTNGGFDRIPTFCLDSNFAFYQDDQYNVEWYLDQDTPYVEMTNMFKEQVIIHFLEASNDTLTVLTNGVKKKWFTIPGHNILPNTSSFLTDSMTQFWVYGGVFLNSFHYLNIDETKVTFDLESWSYKYIFIPQLRRAQQNIILENDGKYKLFRIKLTEYSSDIIPPNYQVVWGEDAGVLRAQDEDIKELDLDYGSFYQNSKHRSRFINTENKIDYIEFNPNFLEISTHGVLKKFDWKNIVSKAVDHSDFTKVIRFQFNTDTLEPDLVLKSDPILGVFFGRGDKGKFVEYSQNYNPSDFYYKPADSLFLYKCDFPPREILQRWTFRFNQSDHHLEFNYKYFEIDQNQLEYLRIEKYQNGYLIFGKNKFLYPIFFLEKHGHNWEIKMSGYRESIINIPLTENHDSKLNTSNIFDRYKGEWNGLNSKHKMFFQPNGIILDNRFWQVEKAHTIEHQQIQVNLFDDYESKSIIIKKDGRNRITWVDRNNLGEPIVHFRKVVNFWYWFIPTVLIGGLVLWLLVKYLMTKSFLKKELQSRLLAESQLTGLRAQMNPHFIFNAIGSIQHLMYQKNPKQAIEYLTSLSGMLRQVLNLSGQNFVTLEEEINYLKKYLKLEQLRYPFTYSINALESNLRVEIPSMMVQPVVENAIIHGIRHLGHSDGRIDIQVNVNNDLVTWIVKDNGIGLTASQQLKSKSISAHRSKALDNLKKRMHLLNTIHHTDIASLTINEWQQEETDDSGTIVHIILPIAQ